jgi:hypothetical protein
MGILFLSEETSVGTPPAGQGAIYPKTDNNLYFQADDGTELCIGGTVSYFGGPPGTDGTWRITVSGAQLLVQRREGGTYVTKGKFTA